MIMVISLVLFPMVQRYKFESKSQHVDLPNTIADSCFQWFKDTNLKVNHNMASKRATTNISFILMPDGIWIRNCLT